MVFLEALEHRGEAREAFLQEACAGDAELEQRVRQLLAAHGRAVSAAVDRWGLDQEDEEAPESIGPYRVLEPVGEGGMGVVYLAEQTSPVRRRVALKLIKAGMDTREVIARFHSERQALALMSHPNIAGILDAGSTEGGRPYFVMEYVAGMPLLQHFDRQRLPIRQRLEIFIHVCHGVQHAHHKGIIHRDIKPSNLLIQEEDGQHIPKIIDFGVAKAIGRRLSDDTLHTRLGGFIGTPEYVSPEQAHTTGLDVDTRTDVYSLGAVLYEVLTGSGPFEFQISQLTLAEMQTAILERDPELPSHRAGRRTETAQERAALRRSDPRALSRMCRNELDWIVVKALEKDRARRYASVSELAADLERYLQDQPVTAGPRTTARQLRGFARRHRTWLIAGAVCLLLLIAGIIGTSVGLLRAREEARRAGVQSAIAEEINHFLNEDLLASVDPDREGAEVAMRTVLDTAALRIEDRFASRPLVEAAIRRTIGQTYRRLGLYPPAAEHLERAFALYQEQHGPEHPETLLTQLELGSLYRENGRHDRSEQLLAELVAKQRRVQGDRAAETLDAIHALAILHQLMGSHAKAEELFLECLAGRRSLPGVDPVDVAGTQQNLSILYQYMDRWSEAEQLQLAAVEVFRREQGDEDPRTLNSAINLSALYLRQKRYQEAEELLVTSLEPMQRVVGPEHPQTLMMMNNLGYLYSEMGRFTEAEEVLAESLEIKRRVLGDSHASTLHAYSNLAALYRDMGANSEAAALAREHIRRLSEVATQASATPRQQIDYAELLIDVEPEALRDPPAGLQHALLANEATAFADSAMLEVLARAYHANGRVDQAITALQQAVAALPEDSTTRQQELQSLLESYSGQ